VFTALYYDCIIESGLEPPGRKGIKTMKNIIETLKQNGYTVYASKHRDGVLSSDKDGYVFAITPDDNVLYIQHGLGGWEISLQYVPSRENGSGCRTNDMQPYNTITADVLAEAERENLAFARKLRAPLYKSSADWKRKYWAELIQL
jgi:hypothetical protein